MKDIAPKNVNLATATSPYTVQMTSDTEIITFYGNKTLAATFAIQASGTPPNNCTVTMIFPGAITAAGNTFSIFGKTLLNNVIASPFYAKCFYTNSAWTVWYGLLAGFTFGTATGVGIDANGQLIIEADTLTNAMVKSSAAIAYSKLALSGSIVNADINSSAAIAYTKLSLAGAILNADINTAAAIAYSKLALTGSILNADINTSADIALTKLAASTYNVIPKFGSAGKLEPTAVTPTNLASLDTTTSITTQLAAKASTTYVDAADLVLANAVAAINPSVKTKTTVTGTTILTAATIKNNILCNSAGGAFTTTLPLISTLVDGYEVTLSCVGHVSNVATIACNASDHIIDQDAFSTPVTTLDMAGYWKSYSLQADAATHSWYVIKRIA